MLSFFYYYGASELLKGYRFNEPRRRVRRSRSRRV